MKLTIERVTSLLTEQGAQLALAGSTQVVIHAVAALPGEGGSIQPDVLYVASASELRNDNAVEGIRHLVCVADGETPAWLMRCEDLNLILLPAAAECAAAIQKVQDWFVAQRRFAQVREDILDALFAGNGLQAIADKGFELLGNPIFINDTSLKSLARSRGVVVDDPTMNAIIERGYLDQRTINSLRSDRILRKLADGEPPFIVKEWSEARGIPYAKYGWLQAGVRIRGTFVAILAVFGCFEPYSDYAIEWVEGLCKLAAIELQKSEFFIQTHGLIYEALINDLLERRLTDTKTIQLRLKALEIVLHPDLYVVSVRRERQEAARDGAHLISHSRLREILPGSMSVDFRGDVVLLLSRKKGAPVLNEEELADLMDYLESNKWVVGISNVFADLSEMSRYYLQSVKSLELGRQIDGLGMVHHYAHYAIFHALEACAGEVDLREICHPGLRQLAESDDPADRELLQTLYLYLSDLKNPTGVAADLHIHRNTLFYRINKIESLLGCDLHRGDVVFDLLLSFKLIRYLASVDAQRTPLVVSRQARLKPTMSSDPE